MVIFLEPFKNQKISPEKKKNIPIGMYGKVIMNRF